MPFSAEVKILDFQARVIGPASLLRELRSISAVTPDWAAGPPLATPSMVLQIDRTTRKPHRVIRDGAFVWSADRRDTLVPYLEWTINNAAVEHLGHYQLFHAGAVAFEDRGLILPAPSGSGKTTLVAALLMESGFRYFSDEVAVLDPRNGRLLPFAKSLYVRSGSYRILATLDTSVEAAPEYRQPDGTSTRYVAPRGEWLPTGPVVISHVILPTYVPGAPLVLTRVPRAVALETLLKQSFNLHRHGAVGIEVLVETLQSATCYRLTFGDVREASDIVRDVVSHGNDPRE